jgi:hypothetical protein
MVKVTVPIGDKLVVLRFDEFNNEIDVDNLTSIDYSNIFGEAVTVSALLNRIGILKAEAEHNLSSKKLDADIYSAGLARQYRREANINSGKFTLIDNGRPVSIKLTEDSLKEAILLDLAFQNKHKAVINAQRDLAFMDSLYWSIQSKDKKLSVMLKSITPEEFYDELIEGTVNEIIIKKPTDKWTETKR